MRSPLSSQASQPDDSRREIDRLKTIALVVLVLLVGVIGTWSVMASLSGAVIAIGVIKTESNPKIVQHTSGGFIQRILVREGNEVSQGQALFELEDSEASASYSIISDQLAAEIARLARLDAENRDAVHIVFPKELTSRRSQPDLASILQRENALFQARNKLYQDQVRGLKQQQLELRAEIDSLKSRIAAADQSFTYLKEQEKMLEALLAQGFLSQARILDSRRTISEKLESKHEYESLMAQAGQKHADLELRLGQLRENRLTENAREMVEVQARITDLRERQKPLKHALERRVIKAPVSGTVNSIKIHTEGGVASPGQPILEITPRDSQLIAELRISPADIEELHLGQSAEVEFSGMNRRVTATIPGKVVFISADLTQDPSDPKLQYFVARINLAPTTPLAFQIKPGLPVTAYIETASRTPLQLWLDPLLGGLRKALRES